MEEGRRILVVDDECDLRVYLEMHDYIVLQAAGANEALAKVRTALPDLVVLVVMTPGMDGIDILGAVRSMSSVPIIMVMAKGSEDDKVRALRLGADDYVTKPFSQRELLARIESALRRAGPHEALQGPDDDQRHEHDQLDAQQVAGQAVRQEPVRRRAPIGDVIRGE